MATDKYQTRLHIKQSEVRRKLQVLA